MSSINRVVRRRSSHLTLTAIVVLSLAVVAGYLLSGLSLRTVEANNTAQTLPFTQDWTNTGLITANDNWAAVPGIEGFFLNNGTSTATGVDPQTILGDTFAGGTTTVDLDVIANQTGPDSLSNGGVAEFHTTNQAAPANTNPTIALNGSGTADAPFIQINLNTTAQSAINVSYNVRDIDCSADNTNQQVVLQYRVGNSGNYANVAGSYIADATTGGNICTLVTPINVTLPAAADNQPLVQLRIITTNAPSNDEWIGIDDINITAGSATPTPTPTPSLSINDVTQAEGNAGTSTFTFTVSLSQAAAGNVTFDIATADGTAQDDNPATEDNDYVAKTETGRTILAGNTSATFTVDVNGDVVTEPNETFFVNITNISGAAAGDVQGLGTIQNDEVSVIAIHDIQGNSTTSAFNGNTLSTRGIVTLLKADGYFLQEPDASVDADPNTSEGIFVFTSTPPTVAVGHDVTVSGTVSEFGTAGTNTEITTVTGTIINSTGNSLPTPVTLTTTILDPAAAPTQPQLEKYEDMRMTGALKTVAPNDGFFDVYTVLTSVARPMREPGIDVSLPVPPDPTSGLVDPNIPRWDENPERLSVDTNGRSGSTGLTVTSNVNLGTITGPLDFAFGEYRLIPDVNPVITNMSAVPLPTPLASEFTVAGFNIENFNNGTTQKLKASLAIRNIMRYPDIIGNVEIASLSALQALATQVNSDAVAAGDPNPNYVAYLIPAPTGGTQHVGFMVKSARVSVTSVTQERAGDTYIDPATGNPDNTHDRPPLVLRGTVDPTGPNPIPVIVVVNHPRSFINVGQDPGAGPSVRAKRKAQGESIADLLDDLQDANPATSVMTVGDFNAYQFSDGYTDPIATILGSPTSDDQIVVDASPDLVDPNLFNLMEFVPASERYTFIFEGTPQVLDHIIVNRNAFARFTRIGVAHMDADFPEVGTLFVNDSTRPERASDHDAPVAYFNLTLAPSASDGVVSGRLTDPNGVPLAGAVVNLSGTQNRKFITNANGEYRFDNVETSGFYTVRPSLVNFEFSPEERSFSQLGNNTSASFTGSQVGSGANAIDTPEYFVRQHYLDFLGREPDENGFNFWSNQVLECGGDSGCSERRLINVSAAYFQSIEFQLTGGLVDGLYRASFARAPRYAEFMPDLSAIAAGVVVGQPEWEAKMRANQQAFVHGFMQRAAFRETFDALSNDAYVDLLISHTNVRYSLSERDGLVTSLGDGSLTRADVLRRLVDDQRFINMKRNEMFVMMEYFGYLRRDPDAGGFAFWLNKLNQFDGNFEQAEMVKAFIHSGEYRARFQR